MNSCISRFLDPSRKQPPWLLHLRSSRGFIIATVSMSLFTDLFLYSMIVPIMPTVLVNRAGVPYKDRELWSSVMLISEAAAAVVSSPIFGYVIDVSGTRKFPYLLGLILLAASMAVLTAARSLAPYIIGRILQGGAASMVAVAGFAIVTDAAELGNLGQTLVLGGLVYHSGGYYAVFGMAFAIVGVDLLLRLGMIEKRLADRWTNSAEDSTGSESEEQAQNGMSALTSSKRVQSQQPDKDHGKFAILKLLKQPRILIAMWGILVQALVIGAFDSTLPVFVETTFGWDAFGAGLIFLPCVLPALLEPLFGYLSDRFGVRIIAFTSFALLVPCLVCLRFVEYNSLQQKVLLCALLALVGLFVDLNKPALIVQMQQVLDDMERKTPGIFGEKGAVAQCMSLEMTTYFAGVLFGPMWGGFVMYRSGWNTMTWTLGLLVGVTALPMLWLGGRPPAHNNDSMEDREQEPVGPDLAISEK
ncbi:hypothetical protein VTN00DRAFT_7186 [Thermoascus crustaceus]|uniref:uncharacterized protein n=1 Tax=Thermoascus crustaceus TaxID=5088 RepID=UPI003743932B